MKFTVKDRLTGEEIVVSELISEVRRGMRNFSTVGGLRQTVLFPFSMLKHLKGIKDNFTS